MRHATTCPTQCPKCQGRDNYISMTTPAQDLGSRRVRMYLAWRGEALGGLGVPARRRHCRLCGHRWATIEVSITELADMHLMAKGDVRTYVNEDDEEEGAA